MRKIKISPLFLVWILFIFKFQKKYLFPLICSVVLHELGHIFVATALRIKIKRLRLSILGARIETASSLSYKEEFLLAFGGPLFGFLGFTLIMPLANRWPDTPLSSNLLFPFALISLSLTVFNLIPLSTLDGGRMLFSFVCRYFSLDTATKMMSLTSFFTLFTFWVFSVYLLIKISSGLSMLVFSSIFFVKCFIFSEENRE